MRYRILDANGDMTFGNSASNFYVDQPEAVAQAVRTRFQLWTGQWFLDSSQGTPFMTEILGVNTAPTRDIAVRERAIDTQGVNEILTYSSSLTGRAFAVTLSLDTIYGPTGDIVQVL